MSWKPLKNQNTLLNRLLSSQRNATRKQYCCSTANALNSTFMLATIPPGFTLSSRSIRVPIFQDISDKDLCIGILPGYLLWRKIKRDRSSKTRAQVSEIISIPRSIKEIRDTNNMQVKKRKVPSLKMRRLFPPPRKKWKLCLRSKTETNRPTTEVELLNKSINQLDNPVWISKESIHKRTRSGHSVLIIPRKICVLCFLIPMRKEIPYFNLKQLSSEFSFKILLKYCSSEAFYVIYKS